jgi:VCBS repeat-containing protein
LTYVIFEVKSEDSGKINKLIKDDLVSRQSILTRDSNSLDMKGDYSYVKIEGSTQGIKRAEELAKELEFKKVDEKKAKKINTMIEEQEDSAASGMGMIFD